MSKPSIACVFADAGEAAVWAEELGRALPEARVFSWREGEVSDADYAVTWKPPAAFFAGGPKLRAIFNAAAGVDALAAAGAPEGVPVIRLEDAGMASQMAEYVVCAALRHVREFDVYAADRHAGRWSPRPRRSPADFPVGVLGLGVLGQAVAEALRGFGFPVRAWTRSPRDDAPFPLFHGAAGLMPFLSGARILVCMLSLTDETRGIVRRETLDALPFGAFFINVARGGHVVEDDLLAALDDGRLSGAALDVCSSEPLPSGHRFWTHPKVELTPHVAALTLRGEAVAQVAAKFRALMRGEAVGGTVDPARGY